MGAGRWGGIVAFVLAAWPTAAAAQGWEIVGGAVGSATGIVAGAALTSAGDGDLYDLLLNAAVGSALGSASGAWVAGRLSGGEPSPWGALLGGALGTVVAVGVAEALDDQLRGDPAGLIFIGFTVSQGAVAGLGAWILGERPGADPAGGHPSPRPPPAGLSPLR